MRDARGSALLRKWPGTLPKGGVYVPLLLEDENGTTHGNDWAHGFMRGMGMRHDSLVPFSSFTPIRPVSQKQICPHHQSKISRLRIDLEAILAGVRPWVT